MRALLLIVVAACASPALVIGPREVGTERAKLVGIFATPSGGHHEGVTLAEGQGRSAIEDEATLMSVSRGEACIDIVVRNTGDHGKTLDAYEMAMVVDGVKAPLVLTAGVVREQQGFVERHGRVCARAAATRRVELVMVHPLLVHRSSVTSRVSRYQLAFAWKLRD